MPERDYEIENAYLKGIIVGMQMDKLDYDYADSYIPAFHLPIKRPKEAEQPQPVMAQAPQPVPVPTPVPIEKVIPYQVSTVPTKGAEVYLSPKEKFPFPPWKPEELDTEHKKRYNQLKARKYGAGAILRDNPETHKVEKLCPGCLEYRELDSQWGKTTSAKDGLATYCKKCDALTWRIYQDRKAYKTGLESASGPRIVYNEHPKKRELQVETQVCAVCHIEKSAQEYEKIRFSDGHKMLAAYCNTCKEGMDKRALQAAMQQNAILSPGRWQEYRGSWVRKDQGKDAGNTKPAGDANRRPLDAGVEPAEGSSS